MKTNVQATSIINYYSITSEIGTRQKQVLFALKNLRVANNMMISKYLNIPLQSVCGRMNELRKKGIVIYHHTGMCPYMNRTTRFFKIKGWIQEILVN